MEVRRYGLKQRIGVLCHELNGTDRWVRGRAKADEQSIDYTSSFSRIRGWGGCDGMGQSQGFCPGGAFGRGGSTLCMHRISISISAV